ncbi:MAG TPA: hypothetical protein VG498_24640 [Terriglobales bacterium]|nr:hypothetical protein [Terriglobales bacterium]
MMQGWRKIDLGSFAWIAKSEFVYYFRETLTRSQLSLDGSRYMLVLRRKPTDLEPLSVPK